MSLGGQDGAIDSNIFVQEARKDSPEGGCNAAYPLIILKIHSSS